MASPEDIERLIKSMGLTPAVVSTLQKDIRIYYDLGVQNIEKIIDRNLLNVSPDTIGFLEKYNFDLIKDMNDDLASKLRDTLKRGIMNGDSPRVIAKQVKDVFDTTKARAEAIARTETNRAYAQGQYQAAEKAGIELVKYWSAINDNRTSELCRRLNNKYTRENAIPINKQFKDTTTGWSGNTSPAHPNCRCTIVYVPKKKE